VVLVLNAAIGVVQEWRAKKALDRRAVLSEPRARVRRDGAQVEINIDDIVQDDVVVLTIGDQVPIDGLILSSNGLEIDESLLTGEADPLPKEIDNEVMSGSVVVAGDGLARATRVGREAYAVKLAEEAGEFALAESELRVGINRIVTVVGWAMIPTAILLLISQWHASHGWRDAVASTVGGLVGMVPEGLVLLTSIAFFVGALSLARRKVLVQELPAVEGLARVDVVCLDKTGTLTDGAISFASMECADGVDQDRATAALAALAVEFTASEGWQRTASVPFSSARKWSGSTFDGHGSWVMGAPEIVLGACPPDPDLRAKVDELSSAGRRVLVVAHSDATLEGEQLPPGLTPAAVLTFEERVRPDAEETMRYFESQGVGLKVISGDNPRTVGAVAERVGVPDVGTPIDARTLPTEPAALAEVIDTTTVFGRVTPNQKRAFVHALQERSHVVAMTGDGVNDALALKDADIGVAMGNGAPATRAVAQIVLLDGRFSVMPRVVAEGRRVIANIERVARLFVTKTVWAATFAVIIGIWRTSYPLVPRQLTVVDALTIGIPGFVLSFEPSHDPARPGFLPRVVRFCVPVGIVIGVVSMAIFGTLRSSSIGSDRLAAQSGTTMALTALGLVGLFELMQPLDKVRAALLAVLVALGIGAFTIPFVADFFSLEIPSGEEAMVIGIGVLVGAAAVVLSVRFQDRLATAAIAVAHRVRRR
jgi:cation-transporting ATPase E